MKKRLLISAFIISLTGGYLTRTIPFAFSNKQISCHLPSKLNEEIEKKNTSATSGDCSLTKDKTYNNLKREINISVRK